METNEKTCGGPIFETKYKRISGLLQRSLLERQVATRVLYRNFDPITT